MEGPRDLPKGTDAEFMERIREEALGNGETVEQERTMTPTAKFRWLKIYVVGDIRWKHPSATPVPGSNGDYVRVLQQWWEDELPTIVAHGTDYVETERKGEWRDIPVEEQT